MVLKIKQFVIIITIFLCHSCKQRPQGLSSISATQISISDSLAVSDSIDAFIRPYRNRVNEVLDSALAYAPLAISKNDGEYNSSAGNLMADIVLEQAGPVFKNRTQQEIDFVVLNHGGIRSVISKGKISARTAYEVMPFENDIVVVALNGKSVRDLVSFLINSARAHPIAGMQIVLAKDGSLQSVNIKGAPFDENRTYNVATSSYLVEGGDDMGFFAGGLKFTRLDYRIRNAMIDYFKKVDTIAPEVDDRFMKLR